jgi:hypothetical protein
MPHERVVGVSTVGWWTKYLCLTDSNGVEYRFSIGKEHEIELKNWLRAIVEQRKESLQQEEKRKRVQVVIDFSFLKSAAERGGLVLTTISCPYCGGRVELPKSGSVCKCNHCGREVYATDIFEKIKNLLSDL